MKKRFGILLLAIFISISAYVNAQEDEARPPEAEPVPMEEIVVTATRLGEKISSVPANVTVITQENIKNSTAGNVPNLLRTEVGLQVTDITGNGRNFNVDIRGFGETAGLNTLVLVDGRRINQPDLSGTDWTLISLDRVERIEIIRGGRGSVLYGDNAAGGVINIITKEGDRFKAGAEAAAGSYDTYKGNAYLSGSLAGLSYALSGSYLNSNGYRFNSDTEAEDAGLNLNYYLGDLMKFNFSTDYHKDNTGLPGAIKDSNFAQGAKRTDTLFPDDFVEIEDYYFKGGPEIFFLGNSQIKIDGSYRKRDSSFFASFMGGTFNGDTEIETTAFSPQVVLGEKIFGRDNNLTFGFDFEKAREDITNTSIFNGFEDKGKFDLEKKTKGIYVHDEFSVLNNLAISGGYRYDRAEYHFEPSAETSRTFDEDLFTGGVNYNFYKKSYAYFSYSKSFRYPVLDELFDFFTNTINTDLVPQTADDYEIGMRHYFTDSLYMHVNLFRIDTDDEIFFNPISGPFGKNENFEDEVRRDGVEVSLAKTFERVSLKGTYTFTDAELKGGQFSGNEVPNVPKHKASLDAVFSVGWGFTLALNGTYIGERPFISDFANDFSDQEDPFILNSRIKYNWKQLTAFLNLNNITDEDYSEFGTVSGGERAFYPSPKFNLLLGVSFDL